MRRNFAFVLGIVFIASAAFAQMEMPKPAPELKKLNFLVGHWTSQGDVKPGPMGPGGQMIAEEHNEWMEGGYFLVIHSKFKGGGVGEGSSIAFMGYNSDEKVYTYDEFNSLGEVTHSKGTVDGDTFTWVNDMKMGPQSMRGRFTMKLASPTSYAYKFELSQDGANWNLIMDGKDNKNK